MLKRKSKGLFVTCEGGEGAGKTTLMNRVYDVLSKKGHQVIKTFEPGGTPLGYNIRKLLLSKDNNPMSKNAELFLFLADRAHHVEMVILPALEEGKIVLCDRFNDSTLAYQGAARGSNTALLRSLCAVATNELVPDLTLLLDLDPKVGLARARKQGVLDRLEEETLTFHTAVRQGFLDLAKEACERFHIIDAEEGIEKVYQTAITEIESVCPS